jgi:hypothetical protein
VIVVKIQVHVIGALMGLNQQVAVNQVQTVLTAVMLIMQEIVKPIALMEALIIIVMEIPGLVLQMVVKVPTALQGDVETVSIV